jgi:hypothetical protein
MENAERQKLERVVRLLKPNATDPTYLVLKAHLLAEEVLYSFIESKSAHPQCIRGVRLSLNQLVPICRALHHFGDKEWWGWVALKKLNSLRNRLAHNLEPKDITDYIVDFSIYVAESIGAIGDSEIALEYEHIAKSGVHPLILGIVALHASLTVRLGFDPGKYWAALEQPANKTVQ